MAKFKKGDRVLYIGSNNRGGERPIYGHGTVDEDDSGCPWVIWGKSGQRIPTVEVDLELLKEDGVEIKIDAERIEKIKKAAKDFQTAAKVLETVFPEALAEYCCGPFRDAVRNGAVKKCYSTEYAYEWGDKFERWMKFCPYCGRKL